MITYVPIFSQICNFAQIKIVHLSYFSKLNNWLETQFRVIATSKIFRIWKQAMSAELHYLTRAATWSGKHNTKGSQAGIRSSQGRFNTQKSTSKRSPPTNAISWTIDIFHIMVVDVFVVIDAFITFFQTSLIFAFDKLLNHGTIFSECVRKVFEMLHCPEFLALIGSVNKEGNLFHFSARVS